MTAEDKRRMKKNECRHGNIKRWNGIMSMGRHSEGAKSMLRKEGINVFRKDEDGG